MRGFLDRHEAKSYRALLKQFKSPVTATLETLVGRSILQVVHTPLDETYLPRTIAFYHCGDSAALAFARKSTVMVLRVLRGLFDRELESDAKDQRRFTFEEVETEARAIDAGVDPQMIFVGLYLAQEFSVFSAIQRDDRQIGIVSFSLGERVYGTLDWDEHIRRANTSLINDPEYAESKSLPNRNLEWHAFPNQATLIPAVDLDETSPPFIPTHTPDDNRKVFVVHGHAEKPKQAVADFLRSVGLEPIILHEQPNQGRTIIEKFEKHSDVVGFAVVLLTPDDFGGPVAHPEKTRPRARQNVVLELGYFMGKLRRNKVCCLHVEGVELPSDYQGVLWLPYDDSGAWRDQLAKELTAAGIGVDSEKLEKVLSDQPTQTTHTGTHESVPNLKVNHAPVQARADDPVSEGRWSRVRDDISKLPEYNREALRLLLEYPSLSDYTALQKLGQLARQHSLASVLPGLQNSTGLVRPVPGQPNPKQPEYDLNWEIPPELRPFVERYFREMR